MFAAAGSTRRARPCCSSRCSRAAPSSSASLTSGETINPQLKAWTRGHECAIERAFVQDASGTDTSRWMYNGVGTPDKPGDLGYWVGYRIAKAYYANASDKKQAIADLLGVDNETAPALLKRSGWAPQAGC